MILRFHGHGQSCKTWQVSTRSWPGLWEELEQILQLQLAVWVSTLFKIRQITQIISRHHQKMKPPQPRPHFKLHKKPNLNSVPTYLSISLDLLLTRAPLGYFYNAPHWGGYFEPPSDLRNYSTDSKNSSGIWKPWKNCRGKTNFIDLGVTSDVTGQAKVKMFDISGLVTSASKIAMLSTNKAN